MIAKTRERVLEAAEQLGYEPDLLAQGPRSGQTRTVGFLVRDIANPLFAEIATGADHVAARRRVHHAADQQRR